MAEALLYHRLFANAEEVRWRMGDIEWSSIDRSLVTEGLIASVRSAVTGELETFDGTRQFMDLFEDDADFTQWLAVWFYEETKHPHALCLWLDAVGAPIADDEIVQGHRSRPFAESRLATLTANFIAEVIASDFYLRLAASTDEPVLRHIVGRIASDEARHASHFLAYIEREVERSPSPHRAHRKILAVLYLWLKGSTLIAHPVKATAEREVARGGEPRDLLGPELRVRVGSILGPLVGQPDLTSIAAVRAALGG